MNRAAEIFNVEELVAVAARTNHWEALPFASPLIKNGENPQAFRADERLGADDWETHTFRAELLTDFFRLHLRFAVGTHAVNGIGLIKGMVIRDTVHSGGGDMDEAFDAVLLRLFEEDTGADDIGCIDIFRGIKRKGSRGVDDDIRASHALADSITVTDVALCESDLIPLRIREIDQIYARDVVISICAQVAHKVDAQKAADTGDINLNDRLLLEENLSAVIITQESRVGTGDQDFRRFL